ncbi:ABC transporter substrate-binding protein [Cohnella mopanensis]|uniref:ABC transporter substrate-binding protein n=1 Tax=Cohnella mopanensis TaxID=2911966 RepID=UPI001EF8577C|nr:ABC transporter substrate-binding protein [Cohnella mopanensis]
MKKITQALLSILLISSLTLAGCQSSDSKDAAAPATADVNNSSTPSSSPSSSSSSKYGESPFFSGKNLPPVLDRLPLEPKLTNELPADYLNLEIGTYGGTLRTARTDVVIDNDVFIINNEPLVNTPGLLGEEVTPNVVKDFKVSDDQKEFTFTLREGQKWSDGVPLTVEDVKFTVEDVLFNPELTPVFPLWLKSSAGPDGKPFTFQVVDDYTFKIIFDKPYGGFLMQLAVQGWRGYTELIKPKHFLQKYHTKYTPLEQLEPEIKAANFGTGEWAKLFISKDLLNTEFSYPKAVGFPVLTPYIQVKSGDKALYERNPYYFKVDAKGNQLPYIDKLESNFVQNLEVVKLKIMAGEIDHSYEYVSIPDVSLLKEHEQEGGYKVYVNNLHRTANDIELNQTFDDPVWRQVVGDARFRQALNLALDKQEIDDTVFYGFANPAAFQGAERDLDKANKLLDEIGLKKGEDGLRKGPDGKTFTIPLEVSTQMADFATLGQLVVEQWKQLGLDVSLKQIDNTLWTTRNKANQLKATIMFTPGPVQWARSEWGQNIWAPLWDQWWNSAGAQGEEPPQDVKDLFQSIFSLRELPIEQAKQKREEIKKNFADKVWYFIHSENIAAPVAVNAKIGNFSDKGWGIAQNFAGEQWFFRK